jgi:hypothetical protein
LFPDYCCNEDAFVGLLPTEQVRVGSCGEERSVAAATSNKGVEFWMKEPRRLETNVFQYAESHLTTLSKNSQDRRWKIGRMVVRLLAAYTIPGPSTDEGLVILFSSCTIDNRNRD